LLNKCHHAIEQNWLHFYAAILCLKDNVILRILKFWVLREPPLQISTQIWDMKVLCNKFHRTINLMALLLTKLGSKNQKNFDLILIFEIHILRVPANKFANKWDPRIGKNTQNFEIWHPEGTLHTNSAPLKIWHFKN
jgi:hypothetical protein